MKVLKIDMERFSAGFKAREILDPYMSGFKEKYVNNEYLEHFNDNYSEYGGVTEFHRLQFLLSGIEINAKIQESRVDPVFRNCFSSYSKSFFSLYVPYLRIAGKTLCVTQYLKDFADFILERKTKLYNPASLINTVNGCPASRKYM